VGVPLVFAFQIWKPVVVVALVLAYDAVVREVVGKSRGPRLSALLLALFATSPLLAISFWGTVSSDLLAVGALPAASTTWGYLPATAALALLAAMFVLAGKALDWTEGDGRSRRSFTQWAAAAGLLASWLPPWEGV